MGIGISIAHVFKLVNVLLEDDMALVDACEDVIVERGGGPVLTRQVCWTVSFNE